MVNMDGLDHKIILDIIHLQEVNNNNNTITIVDMVIITITTTIITITIIQTINKTDVNEVTVEVEEILMPEVDKEVDRGIVT